MASVSVPTVDAACTYTTDAMCTPTTLSVQFNAGPPLLMSPQTITCDTGTMQYTFDNAGTPTQVNSIDCACDVNPCPATPTGTRVILVSPPMADGNCEYTVQADCMKGDGALTVFRYNGAAPDVNGIQTWTCDPTTMEYTYDNAGTPSQINTVTCRCSTSKCFMTTGPGIAAPGPEPQDPTTCIFDRTFACDPGYTIAAFRQTPVAPYDLFPAPKQMRCPGGSGGNWQYELTPGVWVEADRGECRI
uniref:Uncharacterized protein n=1 Tax=Panagrolaimus superbus TaxID=310955 RepID=A0A914YY99_9BILA